MICDGKRFDVVADDAGFPIVVTSRALEGDIADARNRGPPCVTIALGKQTASPVAVGAMDLIIRQHGAASYAEVKDKKPHGRVDLFFLTRLVTDCKPFSTRFLKIP